MNDKEVSMKMRRVNFKKGEDIFGIKRFNSPLS